MHHIHLLTPLTYEQFLATKWGPVYLCILGSGIYI